VRRLDAVGIGDPDRTLDDAAVAVVLAAMLARSA
jgi:hypothetical protein